MRLISALSIAALTTGSGVLLAAPASAHTPDISATCDGVRVGATAYDENLANRWSVTIDGVTQTGTFGASVDQTFPVPQDGATTTWSASVEAADGSYHQDASGVVGPCGTPADVQRTDAGQLGGCDVEFEGTSYGAGDLTYDEQYTDTYVFNAGTDTWDLVTDTEPTITNVVFTPWTIAQQVLNDCVEKAAEPPAEQYGDSSTRLECADDVQVTTTVTTTVPFVYEAETNTWTPGEPVKHTTTEESPVEPDDCADQAVSATHVSSQAMSPAPASSPLVPTSVAAGLDGDSVPVLAQVASPVESGREGGPALLLLGMGGALAAAGALRLRQR